MFSAEEKEYLKTIYKGRLCKEVAEMINQKFKTNHTAREVEGYKNRNHLRSGIDSTFKKGNIPNNKGKKWSGFLTEEQQEKARRTCYKKGNIPKQHRAVGSERINTAGYIEVKVAEPRTWRKKHNIVYEEAYGKIPKGMKVIFADGNKLNINLDNLLLVTDSELLQMNKNKLIKEDGDLTKSGLVLTKLMNKIYEKKRRSK